MAGVTSVVIDGVTYPVDDVNAVDFSEAQALTESQQEQARENIGAVSTQELDELKSALSEETANLAKLAVRTGDTSHGLDFSVKDGIITVNGTATSTGIIVLTEEFYVPAGQYRFGTAIQIATGSIILRDTDNNSNIYTTNTLLTETIDTGFNAVVRLYHDNNERFDNVKIALVLTPTNKYTEFFPNETAFDYIARNKANKNETDIGSLSHIVNSNKNSIENNIGTTKNYAELSIADGYSSFGLTFNVKDGSIVVNGTANGTGIVTITKDISLQAGVYTFGSFEPFYPVGSIILRDVTNNSNLYQTTSVGTVTLSNAITAALRFYVNSGEKFNKVKFSPLIYKESIAEMFVKHDTAIDEYSRAYANTDKRNFNKATYFEPPYDFASACFRIPFCEITNNDVLICGGDIRYNGQSDQGVIDIGIARSFDYGRTFSGDDKQIVLENSGIKSESRVMDGCILCDRNTNRLFLFGHQVDASNGATWETQSTIDTDTVACDCVYKTSDNDGLTWSNEYSIKDQFGFGIGTKFITVFEGPGHGITLENGTLVVPMQVKTTESGLAATSIHSTVMFSTDHGSTWKLVKYVPQPCSECQVVQYGDRLILAVRHHPGDTVRWFYSMAISDLIEWDLDESVTTDNPWTKEMNMGTTLKEPGCCAGFTKLKIFDEEKFLFANPDSTVARRYTTLQKSNNMESWDKIMMLQSAASFGYTCITAVNDYVYIACENTKSSGVGRLILFRVPSILAF